MKQDEAPVPPYLHYHDAADEEESCPQPSALPPALAASRPPVTETPVDAFPRFHSHPPLPPHPLSKLSLQHIPEAKGGNSIGAADSSLRYAGNSPGFSSHAGDVTELPERCTRAVDPSPGHADSGAVKATHAHNSPTALRADSGMSNPSGSSHRDSHLHNSAEPQQHSTLHGLPDQQQHQQPHSNSAIQKQQQQQPSAQQDGSESECDSSDACGDESDLAVGDDELVEHEADALPQSRLLHPGVAQHTVLQSARLLSQHDLASGQMPSAQQQHQHRLQQDNALTQGQRSWGLPQPQQNQGVNLQSRGPSRPQQDARFRQPDQDRLCIPAEPQHPQIKQNAVPKIGPDGVLLLLGSDLASEELVCRQPGKLRAAYRSHCDDQLLKQSQQQAQKQQGVLQQEGSEPVSCYEQPSMQAVSHVLPAPTLPTKVCSSRDLCFLHSQSLIEMIGKTWVIATMLGLHCACYCVVSECAKCVLEQSILACNEYRSFVQPARFSCEPVLYCATDKRFLVMPR